MCMALLRGVGPKTPPSNAVFEGGKLVCYKVLKEFSGGWISPYQRTRYHAGEILAARSVELDLYEKLREEVSVGIHLVVNFDLAMQFANELSYYGLFKVLVDPEDIVAYGAYMTNTEKDCVVVTRVVFDPEARIKRIPGVDVSGVD